MTKRADGPLKRTRRPKVFATECPTNPAHDRTRVYRTDRRKRYCCCDDCGATWFQAGDFADSLKQYCDELAKTLADAEPVELKDGEGPVVLLPLEDARRIAKELRDLVAV